MSLVLKTETYDLHPEGEFEAHIIVVAEIGVHTRGGVADRQILITYESEVEDDDEDRMTVSARYQARLSEGSPLGRVAAAATGWCTNVSAFDLADLAGQPVRITVTHNTVDGRTYANVREIAPATNKRWFPSCEALVYEAGNARRFDRLPPDVQRLVIRGGTAPK